MILHNIKYYGLIIIISILIPACEREVSVSPIIETQLEASSFFIDTNPVGANIWIDGRPSGFFTPDTIKWLKEGIHKIVLKIDLFEDHEFELLGRNNSVHNYYYDYLADPKNFGSILIQSSPPGCTIFFNDSLLSEYKTPHRISSLLPDKYKVKVSYPEHRSDSLFVQVYGSKETIVNLAPIDTTIWVNYTRENSDLLGNTIYDVFVDEDNLVWMATRYGVAQFTGKTFNYFNYNNSPIINLVVNKIKQDIFGDFWIGTIKGLNKIESGTWRSFTPSNSSLRGDWISDFDFDNFGNIWIGTSGGLVKIEEDNWKIYNTSNSGLSGNFIKAIAVDKKDNSIWIGTNNNGIAHFDGVNKWEYFIQEPRPDTDTTVSIEQISSGNNPNPINDGPYIMGNSVAALIVDNDGTVWAGYTPSIPRGIPGGVQKYNGTEWETIDFGLILPFVYSFFLSDDNAVFASTRSGIISFSNTSVKILRELNSGLPTDDIRAVHLDQKGTLWIASGNKGLIKYKNYSSVN